MPGIGSLRNSPRSSPVLASPITKMIDDTTRQRVRQFRRAAGLSQAELSRRTGIHPASICQLERGHIRCWPGHLARIARALKVTVDELRGAA
jgi:DNA-binding XRE family transcriptional regulator